MQEVEKSLSDAKLHRTLACGMAGALCATLACGVFLRGLKQTELVQQQKAVHIASLCLVPEEAILVKTAFDYRTLEKIEQRIAVNPKICAQLQTFLTKPSVRSLHQKIIPPSFTNNGLDTATIIDAAHATKNSLSTIEF